MMVSQNYQKHDIFVAKITLQANCTRKLFENSVQKSYTSQLKLSEEANRKACELNTQEFPIEAGRERCAKYNLSGSVVFIVWLRM